MEINIKTPSRLHLTLLDLNGELGRIDGGLGITINKPNFEINIYDNDSIDNNKKMNLLEKTDIIDKTIKIQTKLGLILVTNESNRLVNPKDFLTTISKVIINFVDNLIEKYKSLNSDNFPVQITIKQALSPHMGLGSKTQISLAIAKALSLLIKKINKIEIDITELTELVSRGGTSGIGYRSFSEGGFILDCGHIFGKNCEKETFLPSSASNAKPARTLVRYNFPKKWKILLSILNVPAGASNTEEINIFQKYCPVPLQEVQELSHLILMQTLPGIIEEDLSVFGNSILKFQDLGFKKIEVSLQHQRVKDLMTFQINNGVKCVGMSSFGPTIYSIFESDDDAISMSKLIKDEFSDIGVTCIITEANNKGTEIQIKD